MRSYIYLVLMLILGGGSVCSSVHGAEPVKLVASFSIIADMISQVTDDRVEIDTIVGPDADAHIYTPTVKDAITVAQADAIFVNGFGFETWIQTLIENSGSTAQIFIVTKNITPLYVNGSVDPHAWNMLPNGMIYVRNIADAMALIDPDHALIYQKRAQAYIEQLQVLHKKAQSIFATIPQDRRLIITAHDAFGYLGVSYGLRFLAPVGMDRQAAASARNLALLIDQIKNVGAAALFIENIANPALLQQIAHETGLRIAGRLYSDALSVRGGPAVSYLSMLQHNLGLLFTALQK